MYCHLVKNSIKIIFLAIIFLILSTRKSLAAMMMATNFLSVDWVMDIDYCFGLLLGLRANDSIFLFWISVVVNRAIRKAYKQFNFIAGPLSTCASLQGLRNVLFTVSG